MGIDFTHLKYDFLCFKSVKLILKDFLRSSHTKLIARGVDEIINQLPSESDTIGTNLKQISTLYDIEDFKIIFSVLISI